MLFFFSEYKFEENVKKHREGRWDEVVG